MAQFQQPAPSLGDVQYGLDGAAHRHRALSLYQLQGSVAVLGSQVVMYQKLHDRQR